MMPTKMAPSGYSNDKFRKQDKVVIYITIKCSTYFYEFWSILVSCFHSMKKLFLVLAPVTLCVLLGACGVTECMDALLPRHSAPLRGSHTFQVIYKGRKAISTTISCERYYDASCSDRGNFWRLREIGLNSDPWLVKFVTIQDPGIGEIKIPRPSCELFVEQIPKEFDRMILVNGETYFYSSKSKLSGEYVFVKRKFAMQKVDQVHAKSVILKLIIKIDGMPLSPPGTELH